MSNPSVAGSRRRAVGPLGLALAGNPRRQAFAPYLWDVAADRAGMPLDQISSASALVMVLSDCRQLVESDVLHLPINDVNTFAFEALGRLSAHGSDWDLVAVVPGPMALAEMRGIRGLDDAMDDFEDLARAVLEAGCDVLAVREPVPAPETEASFRAMAKLAAFFGARTLALGPAAAGFVLDAGFDALDIGAGGPAENGVAVLPASPDSPLPTSAIVSSSWESPVRGGDVDWLRRIARQIRNEGKE